MSVLAKIYFKVIAVFLVCLTSSCGYSRFIRISRPSQISPDKPHIVTDPLHYQAGVARTIITPKHNAWLAGFMPWRDTKGINDNLEIRALAMVDPAKQTFVFITADLIGFMYNDYERLKKAIALPDVEVFVFSSHTHAGPDTIGIWGALPFTSGRDENYIDEVIDQMKKVAFASLADLRPVMIYENQTDASGFSKNRRESYLDTTLSILSFYSIPFERMIGAIVNFGCHAEVLKKSNQLVSSDFVGALRDHLDRQLETTTLFINGALGGMVQPNMPWRDNEPIATRDKFGEELANLAKNALNKKNQLLVAPIDFHKQVIKIPLKNKKFWMAAALGFMPHRGTVLTRTITSEVNVLKIGGITIITVPGEIVPELVLEIKKMSGPKTQVWSLANDEIGYILVKEKFFTRTFKYERTMSVGPDAGPITMNAIETLINKK